MRISDWSSDVCSSGLHSRHRLAEIVAQVEMIAEIALGVIVIGERFPRDQRHVMLGGKRREPRDLGGNAGAAIVRGGGMAQHQRDKIGSASCRERVSQYV